MESANFLREFDEQIHAFHKQIADSLAQDKMSEHGVKSIKAMLDAAFDAAAGRIAGIIAHMSKTSQ